MSEQIFNNINIYLLKNWEIVKYITDYREQLDEHIEPFFEKICNKLQSRGWWTKEFEPDSRKGYVWVEKKSWRFGKGDNDSIGLLLGYLSIDAFMGCANDKPQACISIGNLSKKFGKDKTNRFITLFNSYSKKIQKSMSSKFKTGKEPKYPFWYYLPYNSTQWINILKEEKFVDTILEHFDNLAEFIEPIDKALAEIKGKKTKK